MNNSELKDTGRNTDLSSMMQAAESLAKGGAATIAFAYVSGYLIVTSYLSSFGLRRDAGDAFKAEYIYVGFFYLLFLSVIAVALCGLKLLYDSKKRREEREFTRTADNGELNLSLIRKAFRVWGGVLFLLELCIALQISALSPMTIREYLLVQVALLLSVFLYQLTYYRSLHSYAWDRDSRLVQRIRTCCLAIEFIFALLYVTSLSFPGLIFGTAQYLFHRSALLDSAVIAIAVLFSMTLFFPLTLSSARRAQLEAEGYVRPVMDFWHGLRNGTPKEWLQMAVYMIVFTAVLSLPSLGPNSSETYAFRWAFIRYADLGFAIAVLSGVVLQSAGMSYRRAASEIQEAANARTESAQQPMEWKRWVFRITGVILLYIATTLGYAYVIFGHIPISKNGGDYTTASPVRLLLHNDSSGGPSGAPASSGPTANDAKAAAPGGPAADVSADKKLGADKSTNAAASINDYPCLKNGAEPCDGIIVLDQDSSFLYVTKLDGICKSPTNQYVPHCGPKMWKDGFQVPEGPFRPYVTVIPMTRVASIEDE